MVKNIFTMPVRWNGKVLEAVILASRSFATSIVVLRYTQHPTLLCTCEYAKPFKFDAVGSRNAVDIVSVCSFFHAGGQQDRTVLEQWISV